MQNTEDNKSFLWHKQVNHYTTAILQIQVYTLRTKSSGITKLIEADSRAYLVVGRNLVFLHVIRRKARISLLYSTQHVVGIFSQMFNNKYLYVDHISGCNHAI